MFRTSLVTAALFFMATSVAAQGSKPASKTVPSVYATAVLEDGSIVRLAVLEERIVLVTEHGQLTISLSKISQIDFGIHFPEGLEEKILHSIKSLGSEIFRERDRAQKHLIEFDRFSYLMVEKAANSSSDTEQSQRAADIVTKIKARRPAHILKAIKLDDAVHLMTGRIYDGKIQGPGFKIRSKAFGEQLLSFDEIISIKMALPRQEQALVLDAAKHGSALDQWHQTNIAMHQESHLLITAQGQVDVWPQGVGQYVATPKGYNTAGKGGQFMAGALIGRIGEKGEPFCIGERYNDSPRQEGALFLLIVPSPWNNASTGNYQVRIAVTHEFGR